jgi:SH3-like domain-containing protein
MRRCALTLLLLSLLVTPALAEPVSETGLPIPRFVSLRYDEVNMRAGPGTRYPINWTYHRAGLPVEIINEFGNWREVRDHEGYEGWVHHSNLSGQRTAMVYKEPERIHRDPDEHSGALIMAKPGVIGEIVECEANWCELLIAGRKGWAKKNNLWGVYRQEIFD